MNSTPAQNEAEWAAQFDVTVQQVRDAVQAVGSKKEDVEMYLKGSHSSTDADKVRAADK